MYDIQGNCCDDFCASLCCGPCALVQEEKEVELRTRLKTTAYQQLSQMEYRIPERK